MTYLTHLEILDKALAGVVAQGCASINTLGACAYLSPKGDRCGVGHLLADDATCQLWDKEEVTISAIQDLRIPEASKDLEIAHIPTDRYTLELLYAIQDAHDSATYKTPFVSTFKGYMEAIRNDILEGKYNDR